MANKRRSKKESNSKSCETFIRERKKMKLDNRKFRGRGASSSSSISGCSDIMREVLSRLPVKSLMRFKCVSKHWQFTICQDQGFIELHFTRSKQSCPDLLIVVLRHDDKLAKEADPYQRKMLCSGCSVKEYKYQQSFLLPDLFESTGKLPARNRIHVRESSEQKPFLYTEILKPVNGLICFVNRRMASVCILNPSTRERTPWIASSVCQKKRYADCGVPLPAYFFGFDPATKQHKVICTRRRLGESVTTDVCEVLTVGDNTWRRIDEKVPYSSNAEVSVYSNGFVYWADSPVRIPEYLNVFDVGCEKHKVIKVPKEIKEQCKYPPGGYCAPLHSLLEVSGHIALLQRQTDKTVKLWICEDDTSAGSSYSKWNEVNVELPFQWWGMGWHARFAYFHGVAGEDWIVTESYPTGGSRSDIKNVNVYLYDWKKNTTRKANIGVVSELVSNSLSSELTSVSLIRSFAESLWSVRNIRHNQQVSNSSIPRCNCKETT